MKKLIPFSIAIFFVMSSIPSFAGSEGIELSDALIKRIDGNQSTTYVTFSWKITIYSDSKIDLCYFKISLRDQDNMEFDKVLQPIALNEGFNYFTGTGMAESKHWFQMSDAPMSVNCRD